MRRAQRGAVFVLTIVTLAGLLGILAVVAGAQRISMRAASNRLDMQRAEWVARAGIERAMAELSVRQDGPVTLQDGWATLGQTGEEAYVVGRARFRMEVVDAASLINLNTASQAQLERLPLTTDEIESILDYRESNRNPRPSGGKDEYYNNLENAYNAKLAPFDTVDELLQVREMTAAKLYQPRDDIQSSIVLTSGPQDEQPALIDLLTADSASLANQENGQPKQNINNQQAAAIAQRLGNVGLTQAITTARQAGTFASYGDFMRRVPGLTAENCRNLLNFYGFAASARQEGKINLNTASEPVLNSIPNLPPDMVSAILSRQSSGFTQLGDLFDVPGMNVLIAQQVADFFTTTSEVFLIRVLGTYGDVQIPLVAVVQVDEGIPRIVRIERPGPGDILTRWGWNEEATTEIVLKEAA